MTTPTLHNPIPTALHKGSHTAVEQAEGLMCLTEAVAWVAGEPHTDHPECMSPVLGAFGRAWNDGMRTDEERATLIQYIPRLIGTANDGADLKRGEMALEWLCKVQAPAWLDLAGLSGHATALREMDGIEQDKLAAARDAARDAARAAAWDAARDAARGAARDAAGAAAWDAAWDAARAAARGAAGGAAWAAARAAAWDAARDAARAAARGAARAAARGAARAALEPTVKELQVSAHELFDRMIDAA